MADQIPIPAIKVLCASPMRGGRRCRNLRGVFTTNPWNDIYPLFISNEGQPSRETAGRVESMVPADFSGAINIDCILSCGRRDHDVLIVGEPVADEVHETLIGDGRWIREGQSIVRGMIGLPCELLREPYRQFQAKGKVWEVEWSPGVSPTVRLS